MDEMNTENLIVLLPLLIVGLTVVISMLSIAWQRHHQRNAWMAISGLFLALISLCIVGGGEWGKTSENTALFSRDGFAIFYMALVLVAALATSIFARGWLESYPNNKEEFYLLLLVSTLGALVLAVSSHLLTLFVGIELLSLPIFGMLGYAYHRARSLEASIKYMVLSAVASSFLMFGIAILYAANGSLNFIDIGRDLTGRALGMPIQLTGLGLLLVGFGFKLSLFPFHMWTPDVYEGAPAPTAGFLATVGKIGAFCVLTRFLMTAPLTANNAAAALVLAVFAFLSILAGNLLALRQQNIKRILGYSSIAHMGYLLITVVMAQVISLRSGLEGVDLFASEAVGVYLAGYLLSSLVAFGLVSIISSPYRTEDQDDLNDYRGLFWRKPALGFCMIVAMLSLAGIPLTLGFIGKFYVISVGVSEGFGWLVGAVVIGSAIGLYYYMRVAAVVLQRNYSVPESACSCCSMPIAVAFVIFATVLILLLGIYPMPLISWATLALPVL